ncbi:MAG: hypothetical protein ACLQVY_18840 [Limisphaerales bacterium]
MKSSPWIRIPTGRPGRRVAKDKDREVWARDMDDGSKAVGLFNRGESETAITAQWMDIGLAGPGIGRDLWRQQNLVEYNGQFRATVARHGVVLLRIRPH